MHKNFVKILFTIFCLKIALPISAHTYEERLEAFEKKANATKQNLILKSPEQIDTIKQQITIMVELDQEARNLFLENPENQTSIRLMREIDGFNCTHLKEILKQHQWLTISIFGKNTDKQAWLIVQHADHDLEFQKKCLSNLEKLYPINETDKKNYAYLYDRVAVSQGLDQRYGTQCKIENNKMVPISFEGNTKTLNERRQEMGLEPIEKYLVSLSDLIPKAHHAPHITTP